GADGTAPSTRFPWDHHTHAQARQTERRSGQRSDTEQGHHGVHKRGFAHPGQSEGSPRRANLVYRDDENDEVADEKKDEPDRHEGQAGGETGPGEERSSDTARGPRRIRVSSLLHIAKAGQRLAATGTGRPGLLLMGQKNAAMGTASNHDFS